MTVKEISAELAGLRTDFEKGKQINNIRNGLQTVFDECLENVLYDSSYRAVLDSCFSFLRKIENSALPFASAKYRFDVCQALEALCFCADLLSFSQNKSVIFKGSADAVYISADLKGFLLGVSALLANAVKYSTDSDIIVTIKSDSKNALLCFSDYGDFSCADFQNSVIKSGSLGFTVRFFEKCEGSLAMESSCGLVTIALKIPVAKETLPIITPPGIEDLLYDRLSVIYTAFCGH